MSASDTFGGCRVLAFESRRAEDMRAMIAARAGVPLVVPAVEERPHGPSPETLAFAEHLARGDLAVVIFLTGVGTRMLAVAVEGALPRPALADALNQTIVVARGPKPLAALREIGVAMAMPVPRPHTWQQILELLDAEVPAIRGRRIAVQEYGVSPDGLLDGLRGRGAIVLPVHVYEWTVPGDGGSLRDAIRSGVRGDVDVMLFTAAVQVDHLFRVAAAHDLCAALRRATSAMCIGSIGPATTEALVRYGIVPDLEPTRSNMGLFVSEAAAQTAQILKRKRP
jgi:uroporphyrinogen-III synthase